MTPPNHCAFLWHFIEYFCGILLRIFVETKWFDFSEGICIIILLSVKETLKVEGVLSGYSWEWFRYL